VHESLAFDPRDTVVRDAIPVTTVELTLLDLSAVVAPHHVDQAVDAALHRELTSIAALRDNLERLGGRGRPGTAMLRRLIDERSPGSRAAESPTETSMRRLLLRWGLPAPVMQYEVRDSGVLVARVDAAYPDWRIAVEYESYAHHVGRHALVRDNARRNRLVAVGWTYVAVTAEDLRSGGHAVAATIRAAARRLP
jgi:hypothetical protein